MLDRSSEPSDAVNVPCVTLEELPANTSEFSVADSIPTTLTTPTESSVSSPSVIASAPVDRSGVEPVAAKISKASTLTSVPCMELVLDAVNTSSPSVAVRLPKTANLPIAAITSALSEAPKSPEMI